jgi:hypothetical protein
MGAGGMIGGHTYRYVVDLRKMEKRSEAAAACGVPWRVFALNDRLSSIERRAGRNLAPDDRPGPWNLHVRTAICLRTHPPMRHH